MSCQHSPGAAALDDLTNQSWVCRASGARCAGQTIRVEQLERRWLLAATVNGDGVLVVEGTAGDDDIWMSAGPGGITTVEINGEETTFHFDDYQDVSVLGLGGDDRLFVANDIDGRTTILGGDGNDTILPRPTTGDDYVSGGDGNDTVQYRGITDNNRNFDGYYPADDTSPTPYVLVTVLPFNDEDRIADDVERFIGGDSRDRFDIQRRIDDVSLNKALTIEGGPGDDQIERCDGLQTTMIGGAGDDRFEVSEDSAETIFGGDGNDLVDCEETARPNAYSGGAGIDSISLFDDHPGTLDLRDYPDVENAFLGGADQTAIGNDLANEFRANAGPVTMIGGNGNDTLIGSSGDDLLEGGAGDDSVLGRDGDDTLDGGADTDTLIGSAGNDTPLNGEVDTLIEIDSGTLRFDGTLAEDQLSLRADGAGGLVATFDGEDETFDLDDVSRIELLGNAGGDRLELDPSLAIPVLLDGGDDFDTLTGGAGDDTLLGGDGDDSLTGHDGDDTLDGGFGADVMRGSGGRDTVDYSSRANPIIVGLDELADDGEVNVFGNTENDLAAPDVEIVIGTNGHDRIGGSDADNELHGLGGYDTIGGGGGDDSIFGWHGNDVLHGDDGDDYIEAGAGHDNVYGNGGSDTLLGLAGNDWLFTANDDFEDDLLGGRGTDRAEIDPFDEGGSVEDLI